MASNKMNGASNGHGARTAAATPIAIIGMSCKFGGDATSPSKLWEICASGKDVYSPVPSDRWDSASFYDERKGKAGNGKINVKGGYFIKDISRFDSAFYNYTTDVTETMDPQMRMLLESVYEATEDAGVPVQNLVGSNTAVFAGHFSRDYNDMLVRDTDRLSDHPSMLTGNGIALLSNRISHFYDLRGASMTIDTGCSTSLVALHQAVQTLRLGDSDMAIVGATVLDFGPDFFVQLMGAGVLGPTGKCFAWDERAEGYGRGEGVASILLKPLDLAMRDRDRIHAVVMETGLNQDGKTTTITSPSADAQISLIQDVYRRARLDPVDTGYVEAHMTGTAAGDPIEAEAISQTFGKHRPSDDPVWVGGIKPNIGHTEPVSGLAAIIKTIYMLREGVIPPNLNFATPHPKIPLKDWRLRVPTALTPWPAHKPRRASINNFGYGGTNAHVIMEAAPTITYDGSPTTTGLDSYVYVVSAKESGVAQQMNKNLAQHIRDHQGLVEVPPKDLAFTLADRKSRFPWVTAVRAASLAELADKLDDGEHTKASRAGKKRPRLGFVFNGQGAQWHAMGRELIAAYPVFRRSLLTADAILKSDYGAGWSLYEELLRDEKTTRVHEVRLSQPCSVALQLCLVDLLTSWGITPSAVVSHSSGEIAAAYSVGALSFKQALGVVYYRGELAQQYCSSSTPGSMMAAGLSADKAEEYTKAVDAASIGRVVVACHNSPDSVTLSGDDAAVEQVRERLVADGVFARKLNVPLAYHSHHMVPMANAYSDKLREIVPPGSTVQWKNDAVLFASPVTGDIVASPEILGPDHYCRNLVSPVLFAEALERMCFSGSDDVNVDMIVEIGAHGTLAGPIRQVLGKRNRSIPYVSVLKRKVDAVHTVQDAACVLLEQGCPVDLGSVNLVSQDDGNFVSDLPNYAWNHSKRHWAESRISREYRFKRFVPHELLGAPVPGSNKHAPTWRNMLSTADIDWLVEHKLGADVVLPGAAYIAMAIEAARLVTDASEAGIAGYRLREVDFMNALVIPDRGAIETQFVLRPVSDRELESRGWFDFEVWSVLDGDRNNEASWTQHCKGSVAAETSASDLSTDLPAPETASFLSTTTATTADVDDKNPENLFRTLRSMKLFHGPLFQNITRCRTSVERSVTTLAISPAAAQPQDRDRPYVLHPTTMDSLGVAAYASMPAATTQGSMVVPRSIRHLYVPRNVNRHVGETVTAFVELQHADRRGALVNCVAVNGSGDERSNNGGLGVPRLEMDGLYCQAVPLETDSWSEEANRPRKTVPLCSTTRWEVDIAHGGVLPDAFKDSLRIHLGEEDVLFEKKLDRVAFNYVLDAVQALDQQKKGDDHISTTRPAHLDNLHAWMKSIVKKADAGELGSGSRLWSKTNAGLKQRMADEVAAENAAGKLTVRMGQALAAIVAGRVDARALLEEQDDEFLVDQYYESMPRLAKRSHEQVRQVVQQLAVNRPNTRVLEIGGRSGGKLTLQVLKAFAAQDRTRQRQDIDQVDDDKGLGTLLGHYDFTTTHEKGCSESVLQAVRHRCAGWEALMDFKPLDIHQDPKKQGFSSPYDLVIVVASALGPDPAKALARIRSLVTDNGGKLLIVDENARDRLDTHVVFGGLADFAAPMFGGGDDWRRDMGSLLTTAGFTGLDLEMYDCEDVQYQASTVILSSTAAVVVVDAQAACEPPAANQYPTTLSVVYVEGSRPDQAWLDVLESSIAEHLGQDGATTLLLVEALCQIQPRPDVTYIFTPEMSCPFLDGMNETTFEQLRSLLVRGQGVLWLSRSGLVDAEKPIYAQSTGLLRVAKFENSSKRYVLLDFEPTSSMDSWSTSTVPYIVRVLCQSFDSSLENAAVDSEYAVKDGMLHVPRVYPDPVFDSVSGGDVDEKQQQVDTTNEATIHEECLWQVGRPLVWETTRTVGTLSNLYFADDAAAAQSGSAELPLGFVRIKTEAMALNFRDVLCAMGQIDESSYIHDAAGIVTHLGPETAAASGLAVGDRVMGVVSGKFATNPAAHWTSLTKVPDDMSWPEAASIPMVFLTSYMCLFDIARLQRGERVLIHAGAGGVGQSAIMLAQLAGAEVFTTCSSQAKRDLLMMRFGLDADHILPSRDASFAKAILARTNGQGVDVIVNSLSGPLFKASWDCIARFGRFCEIGKVDIEAARRLGLGPLTRGAAIAGFDLIQHCQYNRQAVHRAWKGLMKLWAAKVIRPVHPISAMPISDMETAMRQMQRGAHMGKLVLIPNADARVKVLTLPLPGSLLNNKPQILDNPTATYLIVGGLGGVGLALCQRMMHLGAKHILILSRNAESHPEGPALINRGRTQGCTFWIRNCDVSHEAELLRVLAACTAFGMPPVRGAIQAALNLQDTILESLTFSQWRAGIASKVAATLNLHNNLPSLRFFVMLASGAGIVGHSSQACYAAGNTFQDALARHRVARGMPATAIDLGGVEEVIDADSRRDRVRERLEICNIDMIPLDRVLDLIEAAVCNPQPLSPDLAQVITALKDYNKLPSGVGHMRQDPRFSTLQMASLVGVESSSSSSLPSAATAATTTATSPDDALKQGLLAASTESRPAVVMAGLLHKLTELFSLAEGEIDMSGSLAALGVDSLVAVELRNWLSGVVQAHVTVFEILQAATLREFAGLVAARSALLRVE